MFEHSGVMSGAELEEVQRVFDRVRSQSWFLRDETRELDLGSYLLHLYSYGIRDANLLYETCARSAFERISAKAA
jgi:hypothetical protein